MRRYWLAVALAVAGVPRAVAQVPRDTGIRPSPPSVPGPRPLLYGFALDCTRCGMRPGVRDPRPVWYYAERPRVAAVRRGGAAADAGVQEGDTIALVDGLSIMSNDGARRFSSVRPGDRVRLTLHRAGKPVEAHLSLGRLADSPPPLPSGHAQPRRYSGEVAGTTVDVWSETAITVTVDSTGAIVVQAGTSTVRVAPKPAGSGTQASRTGPNRRP